VLVVAGMLALACAAIVAIGRLQVEVPFKLTTGALWEILRLVSKDRSDQANEASDLAARQAAKADLALRRYNDTFGHPASDAVLELLGGRLADAVTSCGSAYRMGGDEFCVVVSVQEDAAEDVAILGASALTENGVGFLDRLFIRHRPDARGSRDRERRAAAGGPAHVRAQARRQGSRRQGLERSLERRRGG
jgi:GGDEF domain-containing protein